MSARCAAALPGTIPTHAAPATARRARIEHRIRSRASMRESSGAPKSRRCDGTARARARLFRYETCRVFLSSVERRRRHAPRAEGASHRAQRSEDGRASVREVPRAIRAQSGSGDRGLVRSRDRADRRILGLRDSTHTDHFAYVYGRCGQRPARRPRRRARDQRTPSPATRWSRSASLLYPSQGGGHRGCAAARRDHSRAHRAPGPH